MNYVGRGLMRTLGIGLVGLGLGSAATPSPSVAAGAEAIAPVFANLQGEVVLDNDSVQVRKYVIAPGQSTGAQAHPLDQLLVFIKGGVLTSSDGRATLWKDGRVAWYGASNRPDTARVNSGTTPVEIIGVNLKPRASTPTGQPTVVPLSYPNIPGEDLLENDRVIVQRFVVNPGQWEGVHAHGPGMLYIHIKGGQWAARSKSEAEHAYPAPSPDGKVGWMPVTDLSVGHESGNIGKAPIDLIWVTVKP